MGRVPEFQQQRLTSSAVGTPGVDRSAGVAFKALARFADNIVKVGGEVIVAQKVAYDTIAAGEANSQYKVNTDNINSEGKKEFELDPDAGTDIMNERFDAAFDAQMSTLNTSSQQQKFAKQAQTSRSNAKIKYNNFRNTQNLVNAENKINATLINHNQRLFNAGQKGDTDSLFDILDGDIPETVNALSEVLGPTKTAAELITALSGGASAYLDGALDKQPEQVAQLLENGFIDKFLSTDEQKQFIADAKIKFKALRKIELSDQTLEMINQNQGFWQKFINDDINIEEIDSAIEATAFAIEQMALKLQMAPADPQSLRLMKELVDADEFLPMLRDIILSDNPLDEAEVTERYSEIIELYSKGRFRKVRGKILQTLDGKELLILQSLVAKGKKDNVITKDQANTFVKFLTQPLAEKLAKIKGKKTGVLGGAFGTPGGEPLTAFDAVLLSIDTYTKGLNMTPEQRTEIKVDMVKKSFKVLEFSKITDIKEARAIAQQLIQEKSIQLNLVLGLLPNTPNAINTFSGEVQNVLPGKSRATPSKRITEKGRPIREKATGKWFLLTDDSRKVPITEEQGQGIINNGGT